MYLFINPAALFLFYFSIFFLFACDNKKENSEGKLVKVYADLLIMQDTTKFESGSLDSLRTIVLKRYDLNFEDYKNMIERHNKNPETWAKFFDNVTKYLNELKSKDEN